MAVWDGREGNGRGGTAHVVDLALAASVPVIHVSVDPGSGEVGAVRLITGGNVVEPILEDLADAEAYRSLVRDTLMPHTALEREQIASYFAEVERTTNWRIEYTLLLALLRVKRLPSSPWRQASIADDIDYDWKAVRGADPPGARAPLARA